MLDNFWHDSCRWYESMTDDHRTEAFALAADLRLWAKYGALGRELTKQLLRAADMLERLDVEGRLSWREQ
jgi:hypothetical protein